MNKSRALPFSSFLSSQWQIMAKISLSWMRLCMSHILPWLMKKPPTDLNTYIWSNQLTTDLETAFYLSLAETQGLRSKGSDSQPSHLILVPSAGWRPWFECANKNTLKPMSNKYFFREDFNNCKRSVCNFYLGQCSCMHMYLYWSIAELLNWQPAVHIHQQVTSV